MFTMCYVICSHGLWTSAGSRLPRVLRSYGLWAPAGSGLQRALESCPSSHCGRTPKSVRSPSRGVQRAAGCRERGAVRRTRSHGAWPASSPCGCVSQPNHFIHNCSKTFSSICGWLRWGAHGLVGISIWGAASRFAVVFLLGPFNRLHMCFGLLRAFGCYGLCTIAGSSPSCSALLRALGSSVLSTRTDCGPLRALGLCRL